MFEECLKEEKNINNTKINNDLNNLNVVDYKG